MHRAQRSQRRRRRRKGKDRASLALFLGSHSICIIISGKDPGHFRDGWLNRRPACPEVSQMGGAALADRLYRIHPATVRILNRLNSLFI